MTDVARDSRRDNGRPRRRVHRGRHYNLIEGGQRAEVTDFDFAAYLNMQGVPLVDAVRVNDRECIFTFVNQKTDEAPEGAVKQASIKFANSEAARFADALRRMKKTIYSAKYQRR